jgi:hypothetical protein
MRSWRTEDMDRNHEAPDTLRRLAFRIALLLQGWERHRRDPNRREAFHVMEALRALRSGRYEDGEVAVQRAELVRPIPQEAAGRGPHDAVRTADLRAALEALLPLR